MANSSSPLHSPMLILHFGFSRRRSDFRQLRLGSVSKSSAVNWPLSGINRQAGEVQIFLVQVDQMYGRVVSYSTDKHFGTICF
ncbi:hypothetical protein HanPI659440_Chr05g0188371 [Helianthus annuus]|nr:hypothetical protein HanPI659440_Chr05g0188371 [Helianthus annuus]